MIKIEARTKELQKVLDIVAGVINEKQPVLAVLSHVLVDVKDDRISFTASDLETTVSVDCEADVREKGAVLVPGRKLREILRVLPEGTVVFEEISDHWMRIGSLSSEYKLAGLPAVEFPSVPSLPPDDTLMKVQGDQLDIFLERTIYACASDELQRHLNGVCFDRIDSTVVLVATDGYRLSSVTTGWYAGEKFSRRAVVPRKGLLQLRKILKGTGEVQFGFKGNFFTVKAGSCTLFTRLIDAEFPDYTRVVSVDPPVKVLLEREEFLSALRRVSILSASTKAVTLYVEEGRVVFHAVNPELGDAREEIRCEYTGKPVKIGFNAGYLIDALKVIEKEHVYLMFGSDTEPAVIVPVEVISDEIFVDDSYKAMVMPMRV
jgi:DNA polymerase-3 subunit beta